jgi:hypothetical protein
MNDPNAHSAWNRRAMPSRRALPLAMVLGWQFTPARGSGFSGLPSAPNEAILPPTSVKADIWEKI